MEGDNAMLSEDFQIQPGLRIKSVPEGLYRDTETENGNYYIGFRV